MVEIFSMEFRNKICLKLNGTEGFDILPVLAPVLRNLCERVGAGVCLREVWGYKLL